MVLQCSYSCEMLKTDHRMKPKPIKKVPRRHDAGRSELIRVAYEFYKALSPTGQANAADDKQQLMHQLSQMLSQEGPPMLT